jgi:hypothetical protein
MRVIAEWRRQYYLSITPNDGKVSPASGWYDKGSHVTVSAVTPSEETSDSRLVFSHWRGALSTSQPTESLLMDAPKEIYAEYSRQYLLDVQTQFGTPVGGGWYNADSTADFSVEPQTVPAGIFGWFGVDYVFSHWTGDSSSPSSQASIIMHGPRTVTAVWTLSFTRFYLLIVVLCPVFTVAFWKRRELAHTVRSATSTIRRSRHESPD